MFEKKKIEAEIEALKGFFDQTKGTTGPRICRV